MHASQGTSVHDQGRVFRSREEGSAHISFTMFNGSQAGHNSYRWESSGAMVPADESDATGHAGRRRGRGLKVREGNSDLYKETVKGSGTQSSGVGVGGRGGGREKERARGALVSLSSGPRDPWQAMHF